ncbi:hypothetical protein CIP107578_01998 [Corynebacterium diphtheriae]|uniref:Uncharacterized protein n=1 Tax=Corynebacterium diphtheriae TaxID=1717 RepID=A0A811GDC4_CORDP|nr:hypothetical protein AY481_06460 [Corynebacterium diphtheriae bv. mitis]CAB0525911.1 hypothetical protein CIP101841_02072 [Corynebacterium diphtheriae]CAB0616214.1 hypothetical protein CIP107559_02062 [Corynebacterium diphtheriae]CAB0618006.1 hypothetical protein CIP107558_01990 [Corynebacterium diphtheriae]CAB0619656.1 hypothetical protein CIP107547_02206 [Corynebacterium diphtheriae]
MVGDEQPYASLMAWGIQHMSHQRLTGANQQPYRVVAHRDIRRNISEALFFIRESGIGIVRKESKMQ